MSKPRFDWSKYKGTKDITILSKDLRGALVRLLRRYKLSYSPLELLDLLAEGNRICIGCCGFISAELFPKWQRGGLTAQNILSWEQ